MNISENLKKACDEKNVNRIESIILRQINSDRERLNFEMIYSVQYAENELAKSGIELFAEDDGDSEFVNNESAWTKELWETMRTEIEYNFSKLKFDRIVKIMNYLRSEKKHPDFQVKEEKSSSQKKSEVRTSTKKKFGKNGALRNESFEKKSKENQTEELQKNRESQKSSSNTTEGLDSTIISTVVGGIVGAAVGAAIRIAIPGALVGAAVGFAIKWFKTVGDK